MSKNILRLYPLPSRPDQIVKAVELGFDLFSGSYPFVLTNKSQALIFSYVLNRSEDENYEISPKKRKVDQTHSNISNSNSKKSSIILNMIDKRQVKFLYTFIFKKICIIKF
jgi:hypothetical protein